MTVIALTSLKGSPGVTTTARALATAWPQSKILIELDPSGGDLATDFRLQNNPGLLSLATESRRESDVDLPWRHTQQLPNGLEVIHAPPAPDQARAAIAMLDGTLPEILEKLATDPGKTLIADLGRLIKTTEGMARAASRTLLLLAPTLKDLARVNRENLREAVPNLELLLIGPGPYKPKEIRDALGLPVVAHIARNGRAAKRLVKALQP